MVNKGVLLGLRDHEHAYRMLDILFRLKAEGYDAKILPTRTSESVVPLYLMDRVFVDDEVDFDVCIIGPFDSVAEWEASSLDPELREYIDGKRLPLLYAMNPIQPTFILEQIRCMDRKDELASFSFLFTLGHFHEHLTSNHYIGTYENDALLLRMIQRILESGGTVSIIASEDFGPVPYGADVVYVSDRKEYLGVLSSKAIRYDVVVDGMRIPRFGLTEGERFRVEYQRYFAEFKEKWLPFQSEEPCPTHQLLVEVSNGYLDNMDSISYLFDNTCANIIMHSDKESTGVGYKPYVKLIDRNGKTDIFAFRSDEILVEELLESFIKKLEE